MSWKSSVTTIAYEGSILTQERSRGIFQPDVGLAGGDPVVGNVRSLMTLEPAPV